MFRTVLKAKWPGAENSDSEFALQIFSGLLVFTLFSDVIGRASTLVVEQPNLVKKVVFPLELLPWVTSFSALFFSSISLVILVGAAFATRGEITVHLLSVPLILTVFLPMLLGLAWILSSLGVYLRDMGHIVALILTPMLFLSPVFYPSSALPELGRALMQVNPITVIVEAIRDAVLIQTWPDFQALGLYFLFSLAVCGLGVICFAKTRKGFADVL